MPVTTNFQGSAIGKKQRELVLQKLDESFAKVPGKWRVQFIGERGDVEMKVSGPAVEHSELIALPLDPQKVAEAIARILSS